MKKGNKMKQPNEWETIGEIGVDAGLCWIGDPCYILHRDKEEQKELEKSIGNDWGEFCDKIAGEEHMQFNYPLGHPGLGVVTNTGFGDGSYPVQIRRDPKTQRIAELRVVFIDNEKEEDE